MSIFNNPAVRYNYEENKETFGDAIDLLKDHPDLRDKFYKDYPHFKKQAQEEIKEREDVEEFLKKFDISS